jgi:predicted Zn-dependent protease
MELSVGSLPESRDPIRAALKISSSRELAAAAARILALGGFVSDAEPLLNRVLKEFPPTHTEASSVYLPAIRAALDLAHHDPAGAIRELDAARPYDALEVYILSERAEAYLEAGRNADAAAEYQKIINQIKMPSAEVALAHLGLGRALARSGDTAKARIAYQDFFALWKDADADLPVLAAAKQEYAKLKS